MPLPETGDIDAQLDAALIRKDGVAVHALTDAERDALHELYGRYDQLLGEPDPSLQPPALAACADPLHAAYSQVQKGGRLATLRGTLLGAVMECPLCGSGPATTLDHHLPHDTYRALSINPRNLVPSCQPCNRAKGTLQPVAGSGMLHGYHQAMPASTFLVAEVAYDAGFLAITFSIDGAGIDPALAARLRFQLERLLLNERLPDAVNVFLFGLKPSIAYFRGVAQKRELIRTWLTMAADTYDGDLGLNHWRTAVLRGLAGCDAFLDDPWTYLDRPPAALHAA